MNQSSDAFLLSYSNRLTNSMHRIQRIIRKLTTHLHPLSISELCVQLEEATTASALTKVVNTLQPQLWKLPAKEQTALRQQMIALLTAHVLRGPHAPLRLEAAGWLRLLVQAGLTTKPTDIFVTLVTSAVRSPSLTTATADDRDIGHEQQAYLKMIFDCFWPFRYPYPAFSWQEFPTNEVFYPLAALLNRHDTALEDALMSIFAELPTLDDVEIQMSLLPVALNWAEQNNPEFRRRVSNVLARMNCTPAHEALYRLTSDTDAAVRESAKTAIGQIRKAE